MRAKIAVKLMKKYATCPTCGSDKIGPGKGSAAVKATEFRRSCACGFTIAEKEEDHIDG